MYKHTQPTGTGLKVVTARAPSYGQPTGPMPSPTPLATLVSLVPLWHPNPARLSPCDSATLWLCYPACLKPRDTKTLRLENAATGCN